MVSSLLKTIAVSAVVGAVSAGCVEEECAKTYIPGEPQVVVENSLGRNVAQISLELRTDFRPYVPPENRGIPVSSNLSFYCAALNANGNLAESGCVDGKKFEFRINYIDAEGNRHGIYSEQMGAFRASIEYEIPEPVAEKWEGNETLECIIFVPRCSTDGFPYIDDNGQRRFFETDWRPETHIGTAQAEIIIEPLCPAPMPAFKPVDESEWHSEQ